MKLKRARTARLGLLALVLAMTAVGWRLYSGTNESQDWTRVESGDLVLTVKVVGNLEAVHSHLLGPPLIRRMWEFKISQMAPEGSEVRQGMPVLGFDASELTRRLQEKQAELDAAQKEIEKKKTDLILRRRQDDLRLAEAEAKRDKAALKLERPSDVVAANEIAKLRIDLSLAESEVSYLQEKIAALEKAAEAELDLLEDQRDRAAGRVRELTDSIDSMTISAPRSGTVVYITNRRGEKKKVGDSCWLRDKVIEIPDLREMKAEGEVDEAEAGKLAVGQPARIRLDAYPDVDFTARVETIGMTVQPPAPRSPLRVVRCQLNLPQTDAERMRPGMRFQGTIETDRIFGLLLVPLEAVFPKPHGPVAYRRTIMGVEEVPLTLGRRNGEYAEVVEGLSEGDRISLRDLGT